MIPECVGTIERWFDDNRDGEFVRCERMEPYSIIGPTTTSLILYSPKLRCVLRAIEHADDLSMAVISRYGLPQSEDVAWMRTLVAGRELMFLGDADPPDLLLFAWLRAHLPMRFLGVSDRLLESLGGKPGGGNAMPLSADEKDALIVVEQTCPEFRELVGPFCASLLDNGFKIELEAAIGRSANSWTELWRAFLSP